MCKQCSFQPVRTHLITQACIFTVVENVFENFSWIYRFLGSESKTELKGFSIKYHFPKICIVNNFRYVYTGLINLMRNCIQIKDKLEQLYTYLLKNY
jgi:hypothetical protein